MAIDRSSAVKLEPVSGRLPGDERVGGRGLGGSPLGGPGERNDWPLAMLVAICGVLGNRRLLCKSSTCEAKSNTYPQLTTRSPYAVALLEAAEAALGGMDQGLAST